MSRASLSTSSFREVRPKGLRAARAVLVALALLSLGLGSCGYSLTGSSGMSGDDGRTYVNVSIPTFGNDTYEPRVESEMTAAIKEEIVYDSRWRLTDPEEADLIVTGTVKYVDLQPLSYDAIERIQEYRLRILTEVKVTDVKDDKVVWKKSGIETFADYRVTADVTKSKINKAEAIRKAAKTFAEEFVIKVLDVL